MERNGSEFEARARPDDEPETRPARPGEELDGEVLRPTLERALGPIPGRIDTEQFPGGHSNLTYLIRCDVGDFVVRRPPHGAEHIKGGHDMAREYRILTGLAPKFARVPRPIAYSSAAESPLGVAFYVMERVRGRIVRPGDPRFALCHADLAQRVSREMVDTLADLHSVDFEAAGLGDGGRPESYLDRQVTGWRRRYETARTDDVPDMDRVGAWLEPRRPALQRPALIHNDFKLDNLVLDPYDLSRIVAVLDWEMATIGDPLADLGTMLAYWIDPDDPEELRALGFTAIVPAGFLKRSEVVAEYASRTGLDPSDIVFYYALALYKVAVIGQQLYYRFALGATRDPRFESLPLAVRALAAHAARSIAHDSL